MRFFRLCDVLACHNIKFQQICRTSPIPNPLTCSWSRATSPPLLSPSPFFFIFYFLPLFFLFSSPHDRARSLWPCFLLLSGAITPVLVAVFSHCTIARHFLWPEFSVLSDSPFESYDSTPGANSVPNLVPRYSSNPTSHSYVALPCIMVQDVCDRETSPQLLRFKAR